MNVKEKIQAFFRTYWIEILLFVVAVLLLVVGVVSAILAYCGLLVLGVISADVGVRFWRRYKDMTNKTTKDLYIDVTDTDYDEDVYYVGKESENKLAAKNSAKSLGAYLPAILFLLVGVGICIIAAYEIILSFV